MTKYRIRDLEIDLLKGEISSNGTKQTIEPKVMSVLALLIEANGEIVSQEDIFSKVWPNGVFSQSLIQRSIAILRKSLGDDAKKQDVIITHPKRGYSLAVESISGEKSTKAGYKALLLISFTLLLTIATYIKYVPDADENFEIIELEQLTATEVNESKPKKPTEDTLSFIRSTPGLGNAIWQKSTSSAEQQRVTPYFDNIVNYQWLDKETLLIGTFDGEDFILHKVTTSADATNVSQSITRTIYVVPLLKQVRDFYVTDKNELLLLASDDKTSSLTSIDLSSGKSKPLVMGSKSFTPYAFSISLNDNLVVAGFNEKLRTELKLVNASNTPQLLLTLDTNIYQLSWHRGTPNILLTDGRKLLTLNVEQRQIKELPYKTPVYIAEAVYSQSGKQIIMSQQHIDSDIWRQSKGLDSKIVNSTSADYAARISPSGELVAYISNKKGFPQLFLMEIASGKKTLIFNNPTKALQIASPVWHNSKNKLMSTVNEKLMVVDLQSGTQVIKTIQDTAVIPLAWLEQQGQILVIDLSNNQEQLSVYNWKTNEMKALANNLTNGAVLNPQGVIYQLDEQSVYTLTKLDQQKVLGIEGAIVSYVSHSDGLYLFVERDGKQFVELMSWSEHQIISVTELSNDVYYLWDVTPENGDFIYETMVTNKDIFQLSLK